MKENIKPATGRLGVLAVSYTHLDVYKRQQCYCRVELEDVLTQ